MRPVQLTDSNYLELAMEKDYCWVMYMYYLHESNRGKKHVVCIGTVGQMDRVATSL